MGFLLSTWIQLGSITHLSASFPERHMSHLLRGGRLTFVCMFSVFLSLDNSDFTKHAISKGNGGLKKNNTAICALLQAVSNFITL